jgi:hypothetical protein
VFELDPEVLNFGGIRSNLNRDHCNGLNAVLMQMDFIWWGIGRSLRSVLKDHFDSQGMARLGRESSEKGPAVVA